MKKLNLRFPVIVEGKYDKIKLSNILSSQIITVGGFSLINDKKKKAYLSTLATKTKLIVLTDSDKAGGFIRSKLKGIVPSNKLINLYIPQIHGKEKRKSSKSADGFLGVEGIDSQTLIDILSPYANETPTSEPVTSALFWEYGLSGKSDSAEKRSVLAKKYGLPPSITAKALMDAINSMGGKERFLKTISSESVNETQFSCPNNEETFVSQDTQFSITQTTPQATVSEENDKKTVSFYTLGCRVNQYETRGVAEQLWQEGFKIVPFGEPSDFTFINTCAVTAESERKSRVIIKKGANLSKHVIVAGCYSEHRPETVKKIKGVSFVVGCKDKERCVGAIKSLANINESYAPLSICNAPPKEFPFISSCRAYIKIQDGCNGNCTYCLIHKLRGRSVVRNEEDILSEAKRLAKAGYKEIILTGIESSAYGTKNLSGLIRKIGEIKEIKRIRLGSLDPNVLTDDFISAIKETESFMPHLHLSVQSPNSRILKLMKRPYNGEKLASRIEALRCAIPEIMLSADIITSFPTETEEEFRETIEFIQKYRLLHVHAFSFSPRPGTEAYTMEGKIPFDKAKSRNKELIEASKDIKTQLLSKKIGTPVEILVESFDGKYFKGHTADFAEGLIIAQGLKEGDIITVIPQKAEDGFLICVLP